MIITCCLYDMYCMFTTLFRGFINNEMRKQDPEGFTNREPAIGKKVLRTPLIALGPHHKWSADGHDKLLRLGFPIYGIRDKWSGKWLGLWVVPNNRLKLAVAFLYLSLVKDLGGVLYFNLIYLTHSSIDINLGMPIQSTTDAGSETTLMFALANALRYVH
jgi:hypothetical protein